MIVQIYEITSQEEASSLSRLGVDHIGVLVGDGTFSREQSLTTARKIFAQVGPNAKRSALSLSGDLSQIQRVAQTLEPDILHIGCAPELLGPAHMRQLKAEFPDIAIMRSIPVIDDGSVALARSYDGVADMLLLDSYRPGDKQIGALGYAHNWELDRIIVENVSVPVIIAGGLGPDNVAAAIDASRPAGVDSKTKTDKCDGSHTKDLAKVLAFVEAAHRVHYRQDQN